jgi:hypothetical protein
VEEDLKLVEQLRHNGEIILAIDGIQPEQRNEMLYLLRGLMSGRVLVARNLALVLGLVTAPELGHNGLRQLIP